VQNILHKMITRSDSTLRAHFIPLEMSWKRRGSSLTRFKIYLVSSGNITGISM